MIARLLAHFEHQHFAERPLCATTGPSSSVALTQSGPHAAFLERNLNREPRTDVKIPTNRDFWRRPHLS